MTTASASPKYAIGRLLGILEEARRLQAIIRSNQQDALLRRTHKIHHMIDTRIVGILAEPKYHSGIVSPFHSLITDDTAFEESATSEYQDIVGDADSALSSSTTILFANAMLTGELLFSFAEDFGGGSLLISPEHMGEVYGYMATIEHRSIAEADASSSVAATWETKASELASEIDSIRQSATAGVSPSADVCRAVVEKLAEISRTPRMAMKRLERQFLDGRIENAAQALKFELDLVAPDEKIVDQWRTRISVAKRYNKTRPSAHALETDAVTLAQLQIFNNTRQSERCVLITDDRGLLEAYSKFRREPGNKGHFNAIRDPRQFMPIFNVGEATGSYTDRQVFAQVRSSIDRLLTSFASPDAIEGQSSIEDDFDDIARIAQPILKRISHEFAAELQVQIAELSQAWVAMLEHALVAKADTLLNLADRENKIMLDGGIRRTGERLSKRFLDMTESSVLVRNEILVLRKRTAPSSSNRRMIISDFANFKSDLFKDNSLADNVEYLQSNQKIAISQLSIQDSNERLLVIGCLCLQLGAWDAAEALLNTAQHSGNHVLAQEIGFFRCVGRRLAIGRKATMKQFTSIEKDLQALRVGSDPLLKLRVLSESLALGLSRWALRVHLGTESTSDIKKTMGEWSNLNDLGQRHLSASQTQPAWQGLQKQFALNTFCLVFWLEEAGQRIHSKLRQISSDMMVEIQRPELSFINEGVHGRIYPMLCKYALSDSNGRIDLFQKIVELIDDAVARDRKEGILFDLPYIDRIELARIKLIMTRRHILN